MIHRALRGMSLEDLEGLLAAEDLPGGAEPADLDEALAEAFIASQGGGQAPPILDPLCHPNVIKLRDLLERFQRGDLDQAAAKKQKPILLERIETETPGGLLGALDAASAAAKARPEDKTAALLVSLLKEATKAKKPTKKERAEAKRQAELQAFADDAKARNKKLDRRLESLEQDSLCTLQGDPTIAAALALTGATCSPRVIVFDLETRRLADEVGGWSAKGKRKMGVSILAAWDSHGKIPDTGPGGQDCLSSLRDYTEDELPEFFTLLEQADLVVGFNHESFDLVVLEPYAEKLDDPIDLETLPTFDLLSDLHVAIGKRVKLQQLAVAMFDEGKTMDGVEAVETWREIEKAEEAGESRQAEELYEKLANYCTRDVTLARDIFLEGIRSGEVSYELRGEIVEVEVDWVAPLLEAATGAQLRRDAATGRPAPGEIPAKDPDEPKQGRTHDEMPAGVDEDVEAAMAAPVLVGRNAYHPDVGGARVFFPAVEGPEIEGAPYWLTVGQVPYKLERGRLFVREPDGARVTAILPTDPVKISWAFPKKEEESANDLTKSFIEIGRSNAEKEKAKAAEAGKENEASGGTEGSTDLVAGDAGPLTRSGNESGPAAEPSSIEASKAAPGADGHASEMVVHSEECGEPIVKDFVSGDTIEVAAFNPFARIKELSDEAEAAGKRAPYKALYLAAMDGLNESKQLLEARAHNIQGSTISRVAADHALFVAHSKITELEKTAAHADCARGIAKDQIKAVRELEAELEVARAEYEEIAKRNLRLKCDLAEAEEAAADKPKKKKKKIPKFPDLFTMWEKRLHRGRRPPKPLAFNRGSAIGGGCRRMQYLQRTGAKREPFDVYTLGRFHAGNIWEAAGMSMFRALGFEVYYEQMSGDILDPDDGSILATMHIDCALTHPDYPGRFWVVDIKSMNGRTWTQLPASELIITYLESSYSDYLRKYPYQLGLYLMAKYPDPDPNAEHGATIEPTGFLCFLNKDNGLPKIAPMELSADREERIIDECRAINRAVEAKKIPGFTSDSRLCEWCDFRNQSCFPSVEIVGDNTIDDENLDVELGNYMGMTETAKEAASIRKGLRNRFKSMADGKYRAPNSNVLVKKTTRKDGVAIVNIEYVEN